MIRQEGGLVPASWDQALEMACKGLNGAKALAGILSARNTNEEAFLFAKLMKRFSPEAALETVYRQRELTETEKILKSPDRSPNFRGAREMGVGNGGFEALLGRVSRGEFAAAYVAGEDLVGVAGDAGITSALQKLSFLVVQDIRLTETAKLAHVVFPATHFGEKEGTYTNRAGRVQKLNQAVIPPAGALHDSEIFLRLLEISGEKLAAAEPSEIFAVLSREIPAYKDLSFAALGDQGVVVSEQGAGGPA
jgi:predicted molibdopterin-dependent oxidoreductase YjgC